MTPLLRAVLESADGPNPVATADGLRRYPPAAVAALERCGLLAPLAAATAGGCDSCGEDHVEPVVWADTPGGPRRAFLWCPADGRVRVDPERLRRWAVRAEAAAIALTGRKGVPRLVGRVWHLGPIPGAGRVGWLVAYWRGELGLAEVVPELAQPTAAVFVPHTLPPAGVWGRTAPRRVVPLSAVLTLPAGGLAVDPVAFAAHLGPPEGDDPPAEPVVLPPDPTGGPLVPLPAGTAWEDVVVEVEDHHVIVSTPGGRWRVEYEDAGFADGRTGAPNSRWALLRLLAKSGGELGTGDATTTKSDLFTRSVSDLRAALRALTGLASNPFRPTRRGQAYRTRFRIRLATAPPRS